MYANEEGKMCFAEDEVMPDDGNANPSRNIQKGVEDVP